MAIRILIDGYNLIRRSAAGLAGDSLDLEEARDVLVETLASYKRAKGHPITVVFDAAEGGHLAETKERRRGVEVIYTRRGEIADEVIARLAGRWREGAMVVTDDMELADRVQRHGAFVTACAEFDARCEKALMDGLKGVEEDGDDDPTRRPGKKGPSRRHTKQERRRRARRDRL
ncbi:NYN domain-containing protein [Thermodesulfobacteriota bacterium]